VLKFKANAGYSTVADSCQVGSGPLFPYKVGEFIDLQFIYISVGWTAVACEGLYSIS
jgi:hypothetical protein